MKQDLNPLQQVGRMDGMTVPDGYFRGFAERMASELPDKQPAVVEMPRSLWQKTRPYIYLAAMFAGIWCMLKMFTLMSTSPVDLSIDNNKILTEALSDDNFIYDNFIDEINQNEIFDEMYDDSIGVDDFMEMDSLMQSPMN